MSECETYVIDRLEDNGWVVLERADGETFNVPETWLPDGVRAGQVVIVEKIPDIGDLVEGRSVTLDIYVDEEETAQREAQAREIRSRLKQGPEGDLAL